MKLAAIKQMENYARYHKGVVSLSQGIPSIKMDKRIHEYVSKKMLNNSMDSYSDPQGILELRKNISLLLQRSGMLYTSDEIIITSGAVEALTAVLLSITSYNRNEIIVPTPTYSAYFRIIELSKSKAIQVKLNEADEWKLNIEVLKSKINKHTAAILLCNPNNPTGSIYSKEEILELCDVVRENNITLIVDEVYSNMIYSSISFFSPAQFSRYKTNVIRIMSFSKDFSMTGWRVGYLHSNKKNIEKILPTHDGIVNCAPVISQHAALETLKFKDSIVLRNLKIYEKNKDVMMSYLDLMAEHLNYHEPKGAYFIFPKLKHIRNSRDFCMRLLKSEGLAVVPGSDFGYGGEGHIRLCFGKDEVEIHKGMKKLIRFLKNDI